MFRSLIASDTKGGLVIISGPSGVGKGTVLKEVMRAEPKFRLSISYTTREMRVGEVNGLHYFFITEEEFRIKIAEDFFLEWAEVHGKFYGTERDWVNVEIKRGSSLILEIDCQGASTVKVVVPEALSIFLLPPSWDVLSRRIRSRATDSPQEIERRLSNAFDEIEQADQFMYQVVNDNLEVAAEQILGIIRQEIFL